MPQEHYEEMLLARMHSRHRWENRPVPGVTVENLSQDEIARTVRIGVETGRMPETDASNKEDVLQRLGLYQDTEVLNAAVVLFGTDFLPDFPQCQLRMARFSGVDKTAWIDKPAAEVEAQEFAAFRYAIEAGVDFVMSEHIAVPSVTGGSKLPASQEHMLVTGCLPVRVSAEYPIGAGLGYPEDVDRR